MLCGSCLYICLVAADYKPVTVLFSSFSDLVSQYWTPLPSSTRVEGRGPHSPGLAGVNAGLAHSGSEPNIVNLRAGKTISTQSAIGLKNFNNFKGKSVNEI